MKLNEFIEQKILQLYSLQKYKTVEFDKAINVYLRKNSVSENFLAEYTDLSTTVKEVDLSELSDMSPRCINPKPNGSRVIFKVVPKGKRKAMDREVYVIWK